MHRPSTERPVAPPRCLSMITISGAGGDAPVLHMPSPRAALRHAVPMVFEGIVAPVAVFYLFLLCTGFRGALLAALGWSVAALVRRVVRRDRPSAVLILGVALLAMRTGVAFVTHSATLYFIPPMAWSTFVALVLIASAVARRPFTQRFAHDFCPLDPDLVARPRVQQFFLRISLLWAAVMLVNTGFVLWLLLSTSLDAFVVERTAITWSLTAGAIACSIFGFTSTMRRDGMQVRWGAAA
jgi:hypothetical protein